MSSDEITWQVIGHIHCSFKLKLPNSSHGAKQTFCRNEHNLTGFCTRQSCPLANSRYATVRPDAATGALHLYIKTPERAHLPSQWWEKIQLPSNYEKALAVVDEKLIYWPKFYTHKCKQRLTRLTQVAIRERRIAKETERLGETLAPRLAPKIKRREATRERKAESAAKVERAIERELIDRLRSGAYGDRPLNVEEGIWKKVLRGLERAEKGEEVEDEEEQELEGERELEVEYVSDMEESDAEEVDDMEEFDDWMDGESADEDESEISGDEGHAGDTEEDEDEEASEDEEKPAPGAKRKRPAQPPKKEKARKKGPKLEIEYEYEMPQREAESLAY